MQSVQVTARPSRCLCTLHAETNGTVDEAKLRSRIRTEIDNVARHKSLQGYEIPREFIIEWHPFTKENHLITDSNKMARGQLKKRCISSPHCSIKAQSDEDTV